MVSVAIINRDKEGEGIKEVIVKPPIKGVKEIEITNLAVRARYLEERSKRGSRSHPKTSRVSPASSMGSDLKITFDWSSQGNALFDQLSPLGVPDPVLSPDLLQPKERNLLFKSDEDPQKIPAVLEILGIEKSNVAFSLIMKELAASPKRGGGGGKSA